MQDQDQTGTPAAEMRRSRDLDKLELAYGREYIFRATGSPVMWSARHGDAEAITAGSADGLLLLVRGDYMRRQDALRTGDGDA
jgi:hypothetical protein